MIKRENLLSLEVYARERNEFRAKVIEHKKHRSVRLGEHMTLLFEDELTLRYQVQELEALRLGEGEIGARKRESSSSCAADAGARPRLRGGRGRSGAPTLIVATTSPERQSLTNRAGRLAKQADEHPRPGSTRRPPSIIATVEPPSDSCRIL